MSFLFYLLLTLLIAVAVILILLILIQKGRGGGLSSAFGGGGGGSTAFGAKTGDVLTWATSIIFGIFILLAVLLDLVVNSQFKTGAAASLTGSVPASTPPAAMTTETPAVKTEPAPAPVTTPPAATPAVTVPPATSPVPAPSVSGLKAAVQDAAAKGTAAVKATTQK